MLGVVASCDEATRPPMVGSIEPRIALVQPDPELRASLVLPLTTVRARTIGPTGKVVDLTLQGSSWRGSITGLQAGDYEVIIEGIAAGQVQFYGRIPNVAVARGQRAQPTVQFLAAVPSVSAPPQVTTRRFAQRITVGAVTNATGYDVEVSKSPTFATLVSQFASPSATPLVTVQDTGVYYIRSRAQLPQVPSTSVPWSDDQQWTVQQASGQNTAGTAALLTLASQVPQTVVDRNITSSKPDDWFEFDLQAGDSLFVLARAAGLADTSPLNTALQLYQQDGTTSEAIALDSSAQNRDAYMVHVATRDERHKLRVSGGGTRGHYDLRIEMRRLPRSPSALQAIAASGTAVALLWNDESNNETRFRIDRCTGATCTNFVPSDSVPANITTFTVNGLTQGETYRFRVSAVNGVGTSRNAPVVAAELVGPAAPAALTATAISATRINVAWADLATNETGYEVARCTGVACTDPVIIAQLPANTTSYADLSVTFGNAYRYSVRAVNNVVPSAFTGPVGANTIPPATPSNLVATTTGPTRIALSWTDNALTEAGFRVERCAGDACVNFAEIGSVGLNVTTYVDSTVANNQAYRYRVRAFNAVNGIEYTDVAEANTRPPVAPTALTAITQGPTAIALAWTDNTTIETGYRIDRCTGAGCTDFAALTTIAANAVAFTDNTATVGNVYRYRVLAVGVAGNSTASNIAEANTIVPAAPSGLAAVTITANVIRLTWTDNANNETGYTVSRCATAGCSNFTVLATIAAPATTYDDSTTVAGVSYVYQVRATNVAGASDPSNEAEANTLPPAAPTGLVATTVSATRIDLVWSVNAADGIGTRVERCTGVGCTGFTEIAFVPGTGSTYSDEAATVGNVYRYRLRAQNAADVSPFTAIVEASTEIPALPASFTATVISISQVNLAWSASAGPNLTGFTIRRCEGAGCTPTTVLTDVSFADSDVRDASVVLGVTYRYSIEAVGSTGTSAPSPIVTLVFDVPAAPGTIGASVERGSIALTLSPPAGASLLELERCDGVGCSSFAPIATLPGTATRFSDGTVLENASYAYRVRAANAIGTGPYSGATVAFTTLATAPTALGASVVSGTRIDLSWTDNAINETGFQIERCAGDGCSTFTVVDSVAANVTAFSDLTVTPGQAFSYRVRAMAPFGASLPTNTASVTTRLPAPPSGLVAQTLSNTSIRLTWTDNSDNETQFSVQLCEGAGCTVGAGNFLATPVNATDVVVTGLNTNQTYTFHVFASNTVGNSAPSNTATATTNLPAIPTGLAGAVLDAATLQLTWTDVATDETGYRVERCEGAACTDFVQIAETAADATSLSDGGRTPNVTYRYRVRAFNAAGNSDYTSVLRITAGAPALATGIAATTLSGTNIRVTWTDASDNENSFQIVRCTGVGCTGFSFGVGIAAGSTEYVDTSVLPGNVYRYRVQASNPAGGSGFTDYATASTNAPDAPSALVATPFSATRVDLTWTDNGPWETSYQVERCSGAGCVNFTLLTTLPADAASYSDAGLTTGQSYSYRVRAVNAVAPSAFSNVATASTDRPPEPTGLQALAMSASQIDLSWTDNSGNEDNFELQSCEGTDCVNFAFVALLAPNTVTFSNVVSPGTLYRYRIRAVNSAGESPFSNIAQAVTMVPATPSGLTATLVSGTRIDLAWTDNANNELNYDVERCTGAGCSIFTLLDIRPAGTTSFVDSTVAVDAEYTYRVRATNNVGGSAFSDLVTANTIRPAPPTGFAVNTVSATQVDLTWTDASTNELGFVIERCDVDGCTNPLPIDTVPANVTAFADQTVTAEQAYTYQVRAYNLAGFSPIAGPASTTTRVPAVPGNLTVAVNSSTQMTLTWTDAAINELGYRVERCAGAGCTAFIEIGVTGPDVTSFVSSGLAPTTFYRHRVRAYNNAGTSAFTPVVQTGTFPPTAPNTLTATTATGTQINLAWNDASTNETGFEVQRCEGAGCATFAAVATVPGSSPATATGPVTYEDATVLAGASYTYRIRSLNGVGFSATFSNTATATTAVPAAPSGLTAVANGQTVVQLAWADNSSDETGFRIERCTGAGCSAYSVVTTTAANATTYADVSVTGGNIYQYRVIAVGNGASVPSNVAVASTVLPAGPTGLTAVAVSNNRIELTWTDASDNEDVFRVLRCTGVGCGNFNEIALVAAGTQSYSDVSVNAGTLYRYAVVARNGAGDSDLSNEAEAETNVPGLPTNLVATVIPGPTVRLTWTDNATDESGFEIERCAGASCTDFAILATVGPNVTQYDDAVAINQTFRYRVRAVNGALASGYTGLVIANTNPPAAPTVLVANITTNRVDIEWQDNANNEQSVEVERCSGTACTNFAALVTLPPNTTAYNDAGTVADTIYRYRVRAVNNSGASDWSNELTVNTYRPPVPPDFVAEALSISTIGVSWSDPSGLETSYELQRCVGAGCSTFTTLTTLAAEVTSYRDEGLAANETYRYRLRAQNVWGFSDFSSESEASTVLPEAPTGLTATTVSATQINLAWTDVATNETGYRIERCQGLACSAFTELVTVAANDVTYNDATVVASRAYRYRVRAVNAAGASPASNEAGANTFTPAQPTILAVAANSPTQAMITWQTQVNTDAYQVYRCVFGDCASPTLVAQVPHPGNVYVDGGVTAGTVYRYALVAINGAGASPNSDIVDLAMFPPAAPTGLAATAISSTSVLLNWTDASATENESFIQRCEGTDCTDFVTVGTVSANVTTFVDDGLTAGSRYRYRVFSTNAVGPSAFSNISFVNLVAPVAPSALTATPTGATQILVQWTLNSVNETAVLLERCAGVSCTGFVQIASLAPAVTTFLDNSASAGVSYTYRVRALNNVGPSSFSNEATALIELAGQVTGLTITPVSANQMDLAWLPSPAATSYRVERCFGPGCTSLAPIATLPGGTTTYSDAAGPSYGATVRYQVVASNFAGDAPPSSVANFDIVLNTPVLSTPTVVSLETVDLAWSYVSSWESAVEVLRCTGEGCTPSVPLVSLPPGTTTYTDDPGDGVTYAYAIRTVTTGGASTPSEVGEARMPQGLANAVRISGIADQWTRERHWQFNVPADALGVRFTMESPLAFGDPDLYTKRGIPPLRDATINDAENCVPYATQEVEVCTFNAPAPGTWFVMMRAFTAYSNATLKASLAERFGWPVQTGVIPSAIPGNYVVAHSFMVTEPTSMTHLGVIVGALPLPGSGRVGIYTSRPSLVPQTGEIDEPDGLLASVDLGSLSVGLNEVALSAEVVLPPGKYWLATVTSTDVRFGGSGGQTTYRFFFGAGIGYAAGFPAAWPAHSLNPTVDPMGGRSTFFDRSNIFLRGFR